MNKKYAFILGICIIIIASSAYLVFKVDWIIKENKISEIEAHFKDEQAVMNTREDTTLLLDEEIVYPDGENLEQIEGHNKNNNIDKFSDEDTTIKSSITEEESEETSTPIVEEVTLEETDEGTTSGSEVKDKWVQEEIDENRDLINESDLLTGSGIYNKLDTFYLLDMADGGLTPEEEIEVNEYLDSILEAGEKEVAWELYQRYIYLLNE